MIHNMESALEQKTYYHGALSREDTESLLKIRVDGSFLLRKSGSKSDAYVISIAFGGECLHYSVNPTILNGHRMYSISNGTPYPSPWEVCEHYMTMKGGLKIQLGTPVIRAAVNSTSAYMVETMWYHCEITREEDSRRLSQGYRMHHCNGIFLVRKKSDNKYVLSLVNAGRVHRYIINEDSGTGKCYIAGKSNQFEGLEELVKFHSLSPPEITGIQCQLTVPCPKTFDQKQAVKIPTVEAPSATSLSKRPLASGLASKLKSFLPENSLDLQWDPDTTMSRHETDTLGPKGVLGTSGSRKWLDTFFKSSSILPEECPGYNSIYQNLTEMGVAHDLFITEENISVYEELGKGHFGVVCLGRCKIAEESVACAIKFLTGDDVASNKQEILDEASLMQKLDHPNIIRLIAVCDTLSKLMMILEFAPVGPLRMFLKYKNEATFPEVKILNIMKQVCHGMVYLAEKNIVHRDLAARNILLVSENFAKVSDFGMSRVLRDSENYYRSARPGSWPLRWYSPEALYNYKFTTKCDVWSYGITLWEAFSYGERPYRGMKGREILAMLERHQRLDCPVCCSAEVYDLMLYCWTYDEEQRPAFSDLIPIIEQMYENAKTHPNVSGSWG